MSLAGLTLEYWDVVQTHARSLHFAENILAPSLWAGFPAKTKEIITYLWMCMSTCDRLPYFVEAARRIIHQKNAYLLSWMDLDPEETLLSIKAAKLFCKKRIEEDLKSEDARRWVNGYLRLCELEVELRRTEVQTAEPSGSSLSSDDVQTQWKLYGDMLLGSEVGSFSWLHFAEENVPSQYTPSCTPVSLSPSPAVLQLPSYETNQSNDEDPSKDD